MRIGKNTQKILRKNNHNFKEFNRCNITFVTITYVPYIEGYYKDIVEIIKASISSAILDNNQDYELVIIDNNSCYEFKKRLLNFIKDIKNTTIIFKNQNVGKIRAYLDYVKDCNSNYIYYFDSDIYHYKGYLNSMLNAINNEKFDLLSLFYNPKPYSKKINYLEDKHHLTTSRINMEYIQKVAYSITDKIDAFIQKKTKQTYLLKVGKKNQTFYAGYGHAQFLITNKFLKKLNINEFLSKHNSRIMDKDFDNFLYSNKVKGYILECDLIYHMGNSIKFDKYFSNKQQIKKKKQSLFIKIYKKILFIIYFKLHELLHK